MYQVICIELMNNFNSQFKKKKKKKEVNRQKFIFEFMIYFTQYLSVMFLILINLNMILKGEKISPIFPASQRLPPFQKFVPSWTSLLCFYLPGVENQNIVGPVNVRSTLPQPPFSKNVFQTLILIYKKLFTSLKILTPQLMTYLFIIPYF